MRIKLDENLPPALTADLTAIGHGAATCSDEGIAGTGDPLIFSHSCAEGRVFITGDLDFSDIRRYPVGSHPGIVILRLNRNDYGSVQVALARLFAIVPEPDFAGAHIVVDN